MNITTQAFNRNNLQTEESLFHVANGYLGVRGNFEEGYPSHIPTVRGCYINGVYEDKTIAYDEKLYGFPEKGQRMVSLPDIQTTKIRVGSEDFSLFTGKIHSFSKILDMDNGLQKRIITWQSPEGTLLHLTFTRFTSFTRKHVFAVRITVSSPNYSGPITFISSVGGFLKQQGDKDDPRTTKETGISFQLTKNVTQSGSPLAVYTTISSQIHTAISQKNSINQGDASLRSFPNSEGFTTEIHAHLQENSILTVDKFTAITDSIRNRDDFEPLAARECEKANRAGFETLEAEQEAFMKTFWYGCRITVPDNSLIEERIAFAQFQLLQCIGTEKQGFIAAKGLSGEGYEGHYFWDTEIYVFPFFLFTNRDCAKSLLMFRYSMLPSAQKHARIMGHTKGALYPWRTIKGSECSSYFPSGSAQYHINNDIALTFIEYYHYTKDIDFMEKYGFEVLYETALLFLDTGHFDAKGRFCIDCVTGPDEYTCLVNNNYFTNLGTQYTMRGALEVYHALKKVPSFVDKEVIDAFQKASEHMYLPYNEELGIYEQDDSFLTKKALEIKQIPKENFPLLLHYHPLFLYRHQICKQADTILAHMLYGSHIDLAKQQRSFDYYEKITTHDSTLSECIFCIQACHLGYMDKAFKYFSNSIQTDLENKHGNTQDGLHIANLGGTYLYLLTGFSGLTVEQDGLLNFNFHPYKGLSSYSFRITKDTCLLKVSVTPNNVSLVLLTGKTLTVKIKDIRYTVTKEEQTIHY
jgi:alpha,alpha-trehalose phosphorylase